MLVTFNEHNVPQFEAAGRSELMTIFWILLRYFGFANFLVMIKKQFLFCLRSLSCFVLLTLWSIYEECV